MKVKLCILLTVLTILTGCLSGGSSAKKGSDARAARTTIQQEQADKAFRELEGGFDGTGELEEPKKSVPPKPRESRLSPPPPSETKDYSSSRYLKATGIGQSDAEARRVAKSELSNIFESKISSEVMTSAKAITDSSGGESFKKSIEQNIRVMSAVALEGVEIGNTWFDEKSRAYYAEAVLDKYKARELWEDDIKRIDTLINAEYKNLSRLPSQVAKIAPIKKIFKLWLEKEVIVSRLKVIGFSAPGGSDDRISSLVELVTEIRSGMRIYIDIKGDDAAYVAKDISKVLTGEGFNISRMKNDADVLVAGRVATEPVNLNNPDFKFARARVSLTVTDLRTGNKVGDVSKNMRKGHVSMKEAEHKAIQSIAKAAADEFLKMFGFDGLMK